MDFQSGLRQLLVDESLKAVRYAGREVIWPLIDPEPLGPVFMMNRRIVRGAKVNRKQPDLHPERHRMSDDDVRRMPLSFN
jgi:hypothetical protein